MASNKWSFRPKTTSARTGLPSMASNKWGFQPKTAAARTDLPWMASNKWSFQPRTTAARSEFPSCFTYCPRGNFRAASNNFCTIFPSRTSDIFFKNINNRWYNSSSPLLLLPQQLCMCNSSSSASAAADAAACNRVLSPDSSLSSSPSLSSLPFLMIPSEEVAADGDIEEVNYGAFFSLRDNKVLKLQKELPDQIFDAECRGSSRGWLAYVSRRDCAIYLVDLFSSSSAISPPKIVSLPSILTLPDFKAEAEKIERDPRERSKFLVSSIAMSASPTLDDGSADLNRDCVVVMIPDMEHALSFCRIGDSSWTPLPGSLGGPDPDPESVYIGLENVIYSRKDQVFYSTTDDCNVQAWDFNNAGDDGLPKRIDFDIDFEDVDYTDIYKAEIQDNLCGDSYYLVESPEGEILYIRRLPFKIGSDGSFIKASKYSSQMVDSNGSIIEYIKYPMEVVNCPYRTVFFSAYKLDFEKQIGIHIKSLRETALFLGFNESFSLSTRDRPELKPNSIYFTDNWGSNDFSSNPYGGHDMGVYNFEEDSITPLYCPFQFKKIRPTPIWVSRT